MEKYGVNFLSEIWLILDGETSASLNFKEWAKYSVLCIVVKVWARVKG